MMTESRRTGERHSSQGIICPHCERMHNKARDEYLFETLKPVEVISVKIPNESTEARKMECQFCHGHFIVTIEINYLWTSKKEA